MLARKVSGRSQQERAIKGVERGSQAKRWLGFSHPVSDDQHRECRLMKAIRNPWERQICQSCLAGAAKAVGRSMVKGTKVFSIAEGLGFEGGLSRVSVMRQQEELGPR